eukprot:1183998-Rhodomonas_salina.1
MVSPSAMSTLGIAYASPVQCEIKCKSPHSWCKLYGMCGFLSLISGGPGSTARSALPPTHHTPRQYREIDSATHPCQYCVADGATRTGAVRIPAKR